MKRICFFLRKYYRKHFLGVELFFAFAITLAVAFLTYNYIGVDIVILNLNGIRTTLYGTLVAVAGAMLGFVITGLSVLLTTNNNKQIETLKKSKHYKLIFVIFFSTSKYLGLLLISSLISLIFDKDNSPMITLTITSFFLSLIVVIRLIRCIWVLERIVDLQIIRK